MAEVKFKRGTTQEIENIPVSDGQLIYDTETGEIYQDVGLVRKSLGREIDKTLSIAGAAADAKAVGDAVVERPWELIDTITIKESLPFKINQEPDGTKYNFNKFLVKFDCSKISTKGAGVLYFVYKGAVGPYDNKGIYIDMDSAKPYFYIYGEIDNQNNAKMFMARSNKPSSSGIVDYFRVPSFDSITPDISTTKARFVEIKINEKIPAETIITIYGTRSNEEPIK